MINSFCISQPVAPAAACIPWLVFFPRTRPACLVPRVCPAGLVPVLARIREVGRCSSAPGLGLLSQGPSGQYVIQTLHATWSKILERFIRLPNLLWLVSWHGIAINSPNPRNKCAFPSPFRPHEGTLICSIVARLLGCGVDHAKYHLYTSTRRGCKRLPGRGTRQKGTRTRRCDRVALGVASRAGIGGVVSGRAWSVCSRHTLHLNSSPPGTRHSPTKEPSFPSRLPCLSSPHATPRRLAHSTPLLSAQHVAPRPPPHLG